MQSGAGIEPLPTLLKETDMDKGPDRFAAAHPWLHAPCIRRQQPHRTDHILW